MAFTLKKILPRTLFARSLLILVIPVLLIQVITAFVFFDRHWGRMTSRLAHAASGEIATIVEAHKRGGEGLYKFESDMRRYLDVVARFDGAETLPEVAQGHSAVRVWENLVMERFEAELSAQIAEPYVMDFDSKNKVISVYVQLNTGRLTLTLPQRRLFSSSSYIFLLWVVGASCLLLFVSVLFMRNQVRPIRKLAVAADRLGRGQDIGLFKPSGAKEVRQAAGAFLDMQRRIKRQIAQRTDMLAGVSHDLRTPLTRLKLELEMLSSSHDVAAMKNDVVDMERMISGYLDFVRGDGEEQFSYIDLSDVIERLVESVARQYSQDPALNIEAGVRLRVRPLAFERAIGNLLSNACKYGSHIWVKAFLEDDKKLQIQIEDDGPGIDEALYSEVFKPFKRVDDSRNSETGGVGLGLSIAMDIIQSHGGNIKLDRSEHGGLCVIVRLPV